MKRTGKITGFWGILLCMLFVAGVAFAAISLPDKLKDIPLYPGSKIQQAMDMDKNSMAVMEVKAKGEEVFEFYKKELPAKGWKVFSQMQQDKDSLLQCKKGEDMLHVAIHVADEEAGTVTYNLVLAGK